MLVKVCALIEYERTEFALNAVKDLHQEQEDKIKVKILQICVANDDIYLVNQHPAIYKNSDKLFFFLSFLNKNI